MCLFIGMYISVYICMCLLCAYLYVCGDIIIFISSVHTCIKFHTAIRVLQVYAYTPAITKWVYTHISMQAYICKYLHMYLQYVPTCEGLMSHIHGLNIKCVLICVGVCTYVDTCAHICKKKNRFIFVRIYRHTYKLIRSYLCVGARICVCLYACKSICGIIYNRPQIHV